ncbi:MAG TPA: hypothetical protein VIM56_11300 [Rhizomicrobium sp.]
MKVLAETVPPPGSTNLAGWREVIAAGRLGEYPMEAIVGAFLDLGPDTDRNVRNSLTQYLNIEITRRLRRNVGYNHPNRGQDIIDRAHTELFIALADPESADAKGMRVAFASRVEFRIKDAIADEEKERRIPDEAAANENRKIAKQKKEKGKKKKSEDDSCPGLETEPLPEPEVSDNSAEGELNGELSMSGAATIDGHEADGAETVGGSTILRNPALMDGVRDLDQTIDVNRFLEEHIPEYKKRLAFYLHMQGLPHKSKKGDSIARALGISSKTATRWIEEVQETLRTAIGEQP